MGFTALVIEDSIIYQRVMRGVLGEMKAIDSFEIVGTGVEGLSRIDAGGVDVVFLDMNLPDMNGLDVLDRLRPRAQKPDVIVVSSEGGPSTVMTIKALQRGALEFICKPNSTGFNESVRLLREGLERAVSLIGGRRSMILSRSTRATAPAALRTRKVPTRPAERFWITAVAVSTGGPEALGRLIPSLPAAYPTPIVVVQHMPPMFTKSLADSLDSKSALRVVEAQEGMELRAGSVYIAPGGRHMTVRRTVGRDVIRLNDDPPECNVRPAADVLFRSLAEVAERSPALAVVMTGMGDDGLRGVRELKGKNVYCLTQSADSCVVYGMPRAVDQAGLSDESLPLDGLADRMSALQRRTPLGAR